MPRVAVITVLVVLPLAIASCGGSSGADQARTDACNAVTDINTQVKKLQGYTLTTVTSDKVKANVNSIKSDLKTIKGALPDLKGSLKSQLTSATDTFNSKVSGLASSLGKSVSLQSAANQLMSATDQLGTA